MEQYTVNENCTFYNYDVVNRACEDALFLNDNEKIVECHAMAMEKSYLNYDFSGFKYLVLGDDFNEPIRVADGITHVVFGNGFNSYVEFPEGVLSIWFGDEFNQMVQFPKSLRVLKFGKNYNKPINILQPETCEKSNLLSLTVGNDFNFPLYFNQSQAFCMVFLSLGIGFNSHIQMPQRIIWLNIETNSLHVISHIPNYVTELCLGWNVNVDIRTVIKRMIYLEVLIVRNVGYAYDLTETEFPKNTSCVISGFEQII